MSSVFEPVRQAHAMWLQQNDQLYLEVDEITTTRRGAEVARRAHNPEVASSNLAGAIEEHTRVATTPPVDANATANTSGSSVEAGTKTQSDRDHRSGGGRPASAPTSNGHRPHSSIGKRAAGGRREEV